MIVGSFDLFNSLPKLTSCIFVDEILSMNDEKVIPYIKSAPQQVSDPDLILAAALKIPKNKLMTKIYTEEELESSGVNDLKARKAMMEKDIAKKGITKVGRFFSTKSLSISRRKVLINA